MPFESAAARIMQQSEIYSSQLLHDKLLELERKIGDLVSSKHTDRKDLHALACFISDSDLPLPEHIKDIIARYMEQTIEEASLGDSPDKK